MLIAEMRGHRMCVPLVPHIPNKDPSIHQHELENIPAPLEMVGIWGYAPLDDWARGPILDQAPFQAPGYTPGSLADRACPSRSPTASADADDGSAGRFANDVVRDDDSP
nr:hypothetical protein CFP56_33019 [Quercus suber]